MEDCCMVWQASYQMIRHTLFFGGGIPRCSSLKEEYILHRLYCFTVGSNSITSPSSSSITAWDLNQRPLCSLSHSWNTVWLNFRCYIELSFRAAGLSQSSGVLVKAHLPLTFQRQKHTITAPCHCSNSPLLQNPNSLKNGQKTEAHGKLWCRITSSELSWPALLCPNPNPNP